MQTRDEDDFPQNGPLQGVSGRAGYVGIQSQRVRQQYVDAVSKLVKTDQAGREALKAKYRAPTPPEVRAVIEAKRPSLAPPPGSGGTANRTNARVNAIGNRLGLLGKAGGAVSVIAAGADIARSDDKPRAVGANLGALGLGVAGGEAGASLGVFGGPFAPITVPLGGLAGAGVGGYIGYRLGGGAVDSARSGGPVIYDIFGETH